MSKTRMTASVWKRKTTRKTQLVIKKKILVPLRLLQVHVYKLVIRTKANGFRLIFFNLNVADLNAPFAEFSGVAIDGTVIPQDDQRICFGSVMVQLVLLRLLLHVLRCPAQLRHFSS